VFPSIVAREAAKMLTMLATFAAPVVVLTILIIVAFEIRDAWDRNRIE
jgi:ABC-type microcin C transport system permease subunit YejE